MAKPHTDRNGNPLMVYDRVLIDAKHHAAVEIVGADKSLLSHSRSDGQRGSESAWYDNDRLTLTQRRRDKSTTEKTPPGVTLY